ncbi:MAG: glycosyltransferase family 4 protein [Pirellulales bacterium]|nr:glycosyltransferase family 4 protein [Pirellulales bacterium]
MWRRLIGLTVREIFILCEYPTLNGGERSMLSTLPGVKAAGWTPVALCPPEGALAEALRSQAVEVVPFRTQNSPLPDHSVVPGEGQGVRDVRVLADFQKRNRLPQPTLREELARIIRSRRPALLHANSLAMGRLSGPVAAESGAAGVAHLRDIVGLSAQAVRDLNAHTRLLAVSAATRDFHLAQGLDAHKTFVLHNGVDLESFRPRTPTGFLHRELGLSSEAKLIATVGQLGPRKGQDVLIRAASSLVKKFPKAHFLLIGRRCSEKEETCAFEDALLAAAEGALKSRLHLLGERPDVHLILGELTLYVHPARQEPLGRVLLEAGAAGLPIIATAVGGTPEIFPPEIRSAVLIPPDDPEALAAEMETLLPDESRRRELSRAARNRIAAAFALQTAVKNLLGHYEDLF